MNYVIASGQKLKGSSVAASGQHVDRSIHTPNADPEKSKENVHLIGGDVPLEKAVQTVINQHGGKPRKDSVECIEFVLSASPKFFEKEDGSPNMEKVRAFTNASMTFINDDEKYGKSVKAVLHLDEMTPHIHVHKVPIDPRGRLNCKYHFGSKAQGRNFQDEMREIYKPLGLERGIPNSRAEHQLVRDFYKELKKKFDLNIDLKKLPEPPRTMLLESARAEYKTAVAQSVLEQLEPKMRVMNYQAGQARNEKSRREALEMQFQNYKHETAKKEQSWKNYSMAVDERHYKMTKTLEMRESEIAELRQQLAEKESEGKKIADIPAHEILRKAGIPLKQAKNGAFVYVDNKNGKHLIAINNLLVTADKKILARNGLEVAKLLCRADQPTAADGHQENLRAARFLVHHFGEERGSAAALYAYRELHREDIKNYNFAHEKAALEKNQELQERSRDKDKTKDWTHSR